MTETEQRPNWVNRHGDVYLVVAPSIVGDPTRGYTTEWYLLPGVYPSVARAWLEGLRELERSDDFNVAVVRDRVLAAILWGQHGEIVDDDPTELKDIAKKIGLNG